MKGQKLPPEYSRQADKYLSALDAKTERMLKDRIEKIPDGDIVPYKSRPGHYRLRVRSYRIIFIWQTPEQILVSTITVRGQAYKKGV